MTAADTLAPSVAPVHEHAWITDSVHATSEGRVRYVRCVGCSARRVELEASDLPPTPLTRALQ